MSEREEYAGVTPADLEDLHNVDHVNDPAVGQVLAVSSVDNGRPTWGAAVGGSGGGPPTPPGQAAHYVGTWGVSVAYVAGECVRQWDGAEFKLYQAKTATTGDDPTSVVASWAEVTTPILMWGTEDPNTTDSANPHGGGLLAPFNSAYLQLTVGGSPGSPPLGVLVFNAWDDSIVQGVGYWGLSFRQTVDSAGSGGAWWDSHVQRLGTGDGPAIANLATARLGVGDGDAAVAVFADREDVGDGGGSATVSASRHGSGSGDADVRSSAQVGDTAVGTAYAGATATHHAGGEAHVLPTANATRAWNDVKGDVEFDANTHGPVIHDQSDGHTYRIVCTAGVLSTVLVS